MPFPWAVPGDRRLRALCGPQGTVGPPRRQNAPRRPAAMAGEAHPVPSRTRKLSPRAPIVLRGKPVGDQDAAGRLGAFSPGGAPRRARGPSFFAYGGSSPLSGPSISLTLYECPPACLLAELFPMFPAPLSGDV